MKTKKQFKFFTIFQVEEEQEYLRRMHQKGWKFVGVSFLVIYNFVSCEPEDVVYQLDYNKEGIANKAEYVQMFKDCGWEYLMDFVGFSYFRKPACNMSGEEEIFSDDESRLAMVDRIYKGRMIPLLVLFFTIVLPQFIMQSLHGEYALAIVFLCILILYLTIFVGFVVKRKKYKDNM